MPLITYDITVTIEDSNGDPVEGATVVARLTKTDTDSADDIFVSKETYTELTDENGQAVFSLWPNTRGTTGSQYRFKAYGAEGQIFNVLATVREQNDNLEDITALAAPASQFPVQSVQGQGGDVQLDPDDFDDTDTNNKFIRNTATAKDTPVDADIWGYLDSAASFVVKKISWANIKSVLSTTLQFLQAGSGAISRSIQTRLQDQISVMDFCSVVDGVTDNTAGIQAAIDSVTKGTIRFRRGTYVCGRINLKSNISMIGEPGVIIIPPASVPTNILFYTNTGSYIEIAHFEFQVNKTTYPSLIAIQGATGSSFLYVHDINIEQAGRMGIFTANCTDSVFQRIRIKTAAQRGIQHTGTSHARIKTIDCYVEDCDLDHGIQHTDGIDCEVSQCAVTDVPEFGINGFNASRLKIDKNTVYDTVLEGINIHNTSDSCISNNDVFWTGSASADFGISLFGDNPDVCDRNRVFGNYVTRSGKSGIALAEMCRDNSVYGNTIIDVNLLDEAQGAGVLLYTSDCQFNSIYGNKIVETGGGETKYGINEFNSGGEPSSNYITNNRIRGVATANIAKAVTTRAAMNEMAYQSWTPTVTATAGTITTVGATTCRYYEIERMVFFSIRVTITTNGTGATALSVTLPYTNGTVTAVCNGRESQTSGVALTGTIAASATAVIIRTYANAYPATDGSVIEVSGFFQRA